MPERMGGNLRDASLARSENLCRRVFVDPIVCSVGPKLLAPVRNRLRTSPRLCHPLTFPLYIRSDLCKVALPLRGPARRLQEQRLDRTYGQKNPWPGVFWEVTLQAVTTHKMRLQRRHRCLPPPEKNASGHNLTRAPAVRSPRCLVLRHL